MADHKARKYSKSLKITLLSSGLNKANKMARNRKKIICHPLSLSNFALIIVSWRWNRYDPPKHLSDSKGPVRRSVIVSEHRKKTIQGLCGKNARIFLILQQALCSESPLNGYEWEHWVLHRTALFSACSLLPSAGVHRNHFHTCGFTCGHFHGWVRVKAKTYSRTTAAS
jgi:hypothetical protein